MVNDGEKHMLNVNMRIHELTDLIFSYWVLNANFIFCKELFRMQIYLC